MNFFLKNSESNIDPLQYKDHVELIPILILVKKNKSLINEFYLNLLEYYFLKNNVGAKIKSNFLKDLIFKLNILHENNNLHAIAYALSVWVALAFANCDPLKARTEKNQLWVNSREIVFFITRAFFNLTMQVNSFFEKGGKNVITKNEISHLESFSILILHILEACELIKIRLVTKKITGTLGYKSENFFSLGTTAWRLLNTFDLQIYLKPASIKNIFLKKYIFEKHYLNIKPLIRRNYLSAKNSNLNDLSFINLRTKMKLFIRWELFDKTSKLIFNHYDYNADSDLHALIVFIEERKTNIWRKSIQREISQLFSLNYFIRVKNLQPLLIGGFYFHYYFDFRGRIYADSPIGYTHNRLFRSFYYYGVYTKNEIEEFSKKIPQNVLKTTELIYQKTDIKKKYPNLDFENMVVRYYIDVIFFELGKIFKKKYIEKNNGSLSFEELHLIGIDHFNNGYLESDTLYTKIEYLSLINMLDDLSSNLFLKYAIFKDATASGLQILTLLLGPKDWTVFEKSNFLKKNIWYDTYYYIIQEFLKKEKIPQTIADEYFNRSTLKRTIMTYNYNATLLTCWDYFKDENNLPWDFNDQLNQQIWPFFQKFYKFLKKMFSQSNYYANSTDEIIQFFKKKIINNEHIYFSIQDDFEMQLRYYELIIDKRLDLIAHGVTSKRFTYLMRKISEKPNDKKTFRALQANFTHFFDAYFLRVISLRLGYPVMTIHDSIGIDILNIFNFEEIVQQVFQEFYEENPLKINMSSRLPLIVNSNCIFL